MAINRFTYRFAGRKMNDPPYIIMNPEKGSVFSVILQVEFLKPRLIPGNPCNIIQHIDGGIGEVIHDATS